MRKEYDFSKGKRGPVIASPGKTRITIMLDNDVIEAFRARAEANGTGYQTAINEALRMAAREDAPLTERSAGSASTKSKLVNRIEGRCVRPSLFEHGGNHVSPMCPLLPGCGEQRPQWFSWHRRQLSALAKARARPAPSP